jgi:hypothetical protein
MLMGSLKRGTQGRNNASLNAQYHSSAILANHKTMTADNLQNTRHFNHTLTIHIGLMDLVVGRRI